MSVSCVTTRAQQHPMNYPRRDSIPTIYLPETISAACPIVRWSNWSNSHKITFMPWWWHRRPWRSFFFFLLSAGWSMAIVIIFISFSHNLPSADRAAAVEISQLKLFESTKPPWLTITRDYNCITSIAQLKYYFRQHTFLMSIFMHKNFLLRKYRLSKHDSWNSASSLPRNQKSDWTD